MLLHLKTFLFSSGFLLLFLSSNSFAQTTIINAANASGTSGADGSFQNAGATIAANGWNVVNAGANQWYAGTQSFCVGTMGAYVGTAAGNNSYNINSASINHIYKDVTFPAGQSCITLTFNYKGQGENGYDGLRIYLGSTAVTPVAGTRFNTSDGSAVQLGSSFYNLSAACTSVSITINPSNAGTTKRLVFSWENDISDGTAPAITLDGVSLIAQNPTTPVCATGLTPANAATNVAVCTPLSWTAPAVTGCNAATGYDVYFGTSATPPFALTTTATTYQFPMSPGTVYYWQVRPSNSSGAAVCGIQSFTTTPSTITQFILVDDAVSPAPYNCVTLTPDAASQRGCAWDINTQLDFLSSFSYDMDINLGSNDAGADGMAFVIQNDPLGRCKCGTVGGAVGAGGILNSLSVEIDTYINFEDRDDFVSPVIGTAGTEEPDHLDIWLNGVINPDLDFNGNAVAAGERVVPNAVRLQSPPGTNYNIENGATHKLRITWNSGTSTLTASVLNIGLSTVYGTISHTFNPLTVFGTNAPYFGFTGSTGGLSNEQIFCLPAVLLPLELELFETVCYNNSSSSIHWKTQHDRDNSSYIVERSCNAIDFEMIAKVNSTGENKHYSLTDQNLCKGVTYYRLSRLNNDGTIEILGIRSVSGCDESKGLMVYPNPASKEINVVLNSRDVQLITVKNTKGQSIFEQDCHNSSAITFDVSQLAAGVYYILAEYPEKTETVKVVVE